MIVRKPLATHLADEATVTVQPDGGMTGVRGGRPWPTVVGGGSRDDSWREAVPEDASRLLLEDGKEVIHEVFVTIADMQAGGQGAFQFLGELEQLSFVADTQDE